LEHPEGRYILREGKGRISPVVHEFEGLSTSYPAGGFQRAFAEELKAEYERLGLPWPTLDVAFLAFVRLLGRFGVFTFGPISISVDHLEDAVEHAYRTRSVSMPDDGFARLFEQVRQEMHRTGSQRPNELHYLLAFMRINEGVPARVFGELGVSPEQVEQHARSPRPSRPVEERLYSPEEAAVYLGIRVETVRAWIRSGRLRASRLAGQRVLRIRASDLEAVLEPVQPTEEGRSGDG
jgi:excisionase family DNA binding protein